MTQKEIEKFLGNTKVYVNGKSREIQERLFSFGYGWNNSNPTKVSFENKPFLFIDKGGEITYGCDMSFFIEQKKNREISADEILSLEITKPSYRPFKRYEECWNEMQKHQPFGWLCQKCDGYYVPIRFDIYEDAAFNSLFNVYNFADGTPFGILEK